MSPRTISTDLVTSLKRLRLGGLIPTLAERFTLAEKEDTPYEDLLLLLLTDEISRRDSNAAFRRADLAGLDPDMVLERWDKTAKVTYDRRVMNELVSLRFVEDHRNVVILGPVGVGKTFLSNALGHLCCRAGFNVRLSRADALLRLFKQSRMDNSREALMTQLVTVDVLIIDDFALEPINREESRDIYQLFVERNARASTDCHQQSRHGRVDRHLRRRAPGPKCRRSIQEQRLRPGGRWRVLPLAAQAQHRQPVTSAFGSGQEGARPSSDQGRHSPAMTPALTSGPCRGPPGSTWPSICGM